MGTIWKPDIPPGYTIDLDGPTIIEAPPGNTLTAQQVIDQNKAVNQAKTVLPEAPITLGIKTAVTIPNDTLPTDLDDLVVFLSANKKYFFRFRLLKYTSTVSLNLGFTVPGDTSPATMSWNDVMLDGSTLDEDDESTFSQTGTDIIGHEVSGEIIVNNDDGSFIPQIRQESAGAGSSTVTDAILEVTEIGNN